MFSFAVITRHVKGNKIKHKNVTSSVYVTDYVIPQEISVYVMWRHTITQLLSNTQQ
jgi:hypothetical protein